MKAIHYEKPFEVSVREVPQPKIEHPDDVIVKVTTAGILIKQRTTYFFQTELIRSSDLRFGFAHVSGTNSSEKRAHLRCALSFMCNHQMTRLFPSS